MNIRQFAIVTMLVAGFLLSCSLISAPTLVHVSPTSSVEVSTSSLPSSATISPATSNPINDIGSVIISPKDGMKLIFVPAGEFLMGNDNGARDERPAHSIYLDTFWIDETEVTNAMYKLCEQDGICNQPFETIYYSDPEFVENPVNYVSWDDAKTYCSWADRRLPTEAEWEKVASWDSNSQTKRIYPWGEMIDCSFANYYSEDGCIGYPSKVGSYPSGVSPYGALDMAGNVMEWVSDFYDETYYFNSPSSNPPGPTSGMYHVLRGGSFLDDISQVRSSARQSAGNIWETFYDMVGFRCAMSNTN